MAPRGSIELTTMRWFITATRAVFRGGEDLVDLPGVGVGIGAGSRPVDGEVAGRLRPELRRAVAQRGARVDDRRQRLVFDRDEFGGVLRRGGGLGDHHRDRLADMHHPLAGERRPGRHHERLAAAARQRRMPADIADAFEIVGGEHADDAGRALGAAGVDAMMRAKACGERTKYA